MTEFDIHYQSINSYEESVSEAIFEFCILPCNDHSQTLIDYSVSNSLGEPSFSYKNTFGFEINRIRTTKEFSEFNFVLKSRIDKKNVDYPDYMFLSLQEEKDLLTSNDFFIENHLYLGKTSFTSISPEHLAELEPYQGKQHVFKFLDDLNSFIHHEIEYKKNATDVKTTADQIMTLRAGVCQDFTHLFIAIARANKIPVRYVSGYLNQGKQFIGDTLMHAWVEALVPGAGWIGFDPTNNQITDINYIKVAHGLDYNDCSPIKGVLKTTGENKTIYKVKVVEQ
jgi:hypothetical protein